jgi:uncharacterized membrane protein YfcA
MVIHCATSRNGAEQVHRQMVDVVGGWSALALILAGAFVGGFVNGLTGFGTALTGLPLWLQALEPRVAAQLASACSVVGHIATIKEVFREADWRRLAPMLLAGLAGVPIGTMLIPSIGLSTFKLAVGFILVTYCSFMLAAAGRVKLNAGGRLAEALIGFGGGIMGGLAALSGVLPTVWAALKGWSKAERRAVFQAFNMTILTAMLLSSLVQGMIERTSMIALALALPGTFAGNWVGVQLYRRLDDVRFDRIVLGVLLLSGLGLIWSGL